MDTAQQTDPRHVLVARADEELAHAHEQITRAAEEIARAEQQLSKLEHDAAPGNRRLFDRPAVRGLTGLLLAACIGAAAFAWQSPYGVAAKEIIARWAPQGVATSSPPLENPDLPARPGPPAVQVAAAKTAPPQPALLAQTVPEDDAPTASAPSPELRRLLQSMARDLATLRQEIEQLKASHEQMARDNANTAEQLKVNREQIARVIAKASEANASEAKAQSPRPRISAPPPRPTATPPRRPVPTL
jgi:septal ring factor EnvC (AmiA/AmiB activator)